MIRQPAVKGTPEQRRAARTQRRAANRANHVKTRAQQAGSSRELLVVACNAALAAGKRLTDDARRDLAWAIARVVETADTPQNHKDAS